MTSTVGDIPQLDIKAGHVTTLPARAGLTAVHMFDGASIDAVNAALAAGRPLLLRGEPGTGKSQLAHAAAQELGWPLVSTVVDSRVEARDLLWRFDAVARLAAAQIAGALGPGAVEGLAEANFVSPGPLWWAFHWNSAKDRLEHCCERTRQTARTPMQPEGWKPGGGVVVLLDEIDKADPDVPNGLLEALGEGRFTPIGGPEITMMGQAPLVMITSNEERALPDAFVRRCLVLELTLPPMRADLVAHLQRIGRAHFSKVDMRVLAQAAELLDDDRSHARKQGWPLPGQAEYLDLVRAVTRRPRAGDVQAQLADLKRLARFTYQKQPGQADLSGERGP